MARIVNIKFFSDSLSGSRFIQVRNHICQLYYLTRDDIPSILKDLSASLDTPALYILINKEMRQAYVGQTDSFAKRISQHQAKKEFWNEVLAFVASDDSINATEIQYLEALAYEKAKGANTYDLSANAQMPKRHKISPLTKENTQDFFDVVCGLTHLVGCDIFNPNNTNSAAALSVSTPQKDSREEGELSLKGSGIRIYLNGEGPYPKNRFVLEVIREYIKRNPFVTIQHLKDVFPTEILGNWKTWPLIEPDIKAASELPNKRHFLDTDSILTSPGDHVHFVVSSQWDYHNLPEIFMRVKSFGWDYEIVQRDSIQRTNSFDNRLPSSK